MEEHLYIYKAKCYYVVDGDTVKAMVDVGFKTHIDVTIRFRGINAPESRTRDLEEKKRGLAAKDRVIKILEANHYEFYLRSYGVGKFGRCLGELFVNALPESSPSAPVSINQQLIIEGHATKYNGGKRK